jgi:DNA-binding CsgD family transcriptional regulator
MLVGRGSECSRIDQLLADARHSQAGTLVLRGEAGIGKTALLAYAEERAAGMTVLHARGIESEAELAFSGLLEIARPILGALPSIPKPQAAALCGALALAPAAAGDRFTIGAATLSLLAAASEQTPLLVLVDDAHWLDGPSADALRFAARRLEADAVALVLAVREDAGRELDTAGLAELRLGGLSLEDSTWLLAQHNAGVSPRVAEALYAATAGNPLALLELPRALSREQLAGSEPIEEPVRAGARLEQAFVRRAADLPPASQRALLVAAAGTSESLQPVLDALPAVEAAAADLEAAEQAGLLRIESGDVRFRHPLVRSSVYHAAAPSEQRAAHLALAESLFASGELERRAWHLAEATLTPDETIAAELEQVAAGARERSGYAAAASAWERSARLTPDRARRASRLYAAAEAAWEAGYAAQADRLLDAALPDCHDPRVRADIQHLRGRILLRGGAPLEAHQLLVREAEAMLGEDAEKAAFMLAEAAEARIYAGDFVEASETAARASALAPSDSAAGAYRDGVLGAALVNTSRADEGRSLLLRFADAIESDGELRSDPFMVCMALNGPAWRDELPEALEAAEQAVEAIRRQSAIGDLGYALLYLACFQAATGNWSEGYATALEAVRVTRETSQTSDLVFSLWLAAITDGGRGRVDDAMRAIQEAREIAASSGSLEEWPAFALGFLYLSNGDPAEATGTLEPAVRLEMTHAQQCPVMAPFDLVEAYLRSGKADRAAAALERIEAGYASRSWELAGILRCHGLLDPESVCFVALEEASRRFAVLSMPFERARTDLYLGERLRRAGKPRDARAPLHDALEIFDGLVAEPWAERARRELRATGETVRRPDPGPSEQLTPQELQIALVIARGRTNREAGAELFLSPKTIEAHLSRVYRKLGITSRTQLVRLLSDTSPPEALMEPAAHEPRPTRV